MCKNFRAEYLKLGLFKKRVINQTADLCVVQEGKKEFQSLFWESLNVDYVEISYREFDLNLTIITKALIEKVGPLDTVKNYTQWILHC